jgi:DNA-binding SARP family transcriptional activator
VVPLADPKRQRTCTVHATRNFLRAPACQLLLYTAEKNGGREQVKERKIRAVTAGKTNPGRSTVSTQAPTALAKITQPSVSRSYARPRVFQLLDQLADRHIIWLSAPAGYGKTTVVSSYLHLRKSPTIWYQCDEGDADIASFFFHLSLARDKLEARLQPPVPGFSPEHFAQIPTFTRNFCRAWFTPLPRQTTLVLDNLQDVPADAVLLGMLPIIGDEIPDGVKIIVISRAEPVANLSRLSANARMAVLGVDELQLSRSETADIVDLYAPRRDPGPGLDTDYLHAMTHGWVAGLTVLLRHANTATAPRATVPPGSSQAIFNYLAAEVFDRLKPPVRDFLLRTACLDHITVPVARHVSGNSGAAAILDTLVRQNAFTVYRPLADSYYYHPLFRGFLRSQLDSTMSAARQRELLLDAARSLGETGDAQASINLFLRAGEWDEAASRILRIAPQLLQHTRLKTLSDWLDTLPAEMVSRSGWLSYWRGAHQLTTHFPAARGTFEHAYALFVVEHDKLGQMLACGSILQHIAYCYADYKPMLPWIAIMGSLFDEAPPFPSLSVELQITSGFMLALTMANSRDPSLPRAIGRVSTLIAADVDRPSRAAGISALLHFYAGVGRTPQYGDLDERATEILGDQTLGPAIRLRIAWMLAYLLHLSGESQRVLVLLEAGRVLARRHNLVFDDLHLHLAQLQAREFDPDDAQVAVELSSLEPVARQTPPICAAQFLYLRAMHELACGNILSALSYAEESLPLIRASHWPRGECVLWLGLAEISCALGRYADAVRCVSMTEEIVAGVDGPLLEFNCKLVRAEIARRTGRQDFAALLAAALGIGRKLGFANSFHSCCRLLPTLIPHALELNIEVAYCRWIIGRRGLKPPRADIAKWPWPIRIRAMGQLEVEVDDVPLRFAGKVQRKPLELLKALLTHSQGIAAVRLMDLLWPDSEGDSARNSLDLAVHRLRKLLRHKDAVLLLQGRLMLNPDTVWVDAFVLGRMSVEDVAYGDLKGRADELLRLYRAPLLAGDDAEPIPAARERLRSQFARVIKALANKLSDAAAWDLMTSLCLRAIEAEPLEEALHRELIRGLLAQGHHTEAQIAYARCERILTRTLGRTPSPTTRLLLEPILNVGSESDGKEDGSFCV